MQDRRDAENSRVSPKDKVTIKECLATVNRLEKSGFLAKEWVELVKAMRHPEQGPKEAL